MFLCKFGGENPTGSEERAQKRLLLQFFCKDDDLEKVSITKIMTTLHFVTIMQYIKFS